MCHFTMDTYHGITFHIAHRAHPELRNRAISYGEIDWSLQRSGRIRYKRTVSTNFAGREKTVLITGASSGIGLQLAHLFANDVYHLVLAARTRAPLRALADDPQPRHNVTVRVSPKDLAH